MQAGGTRGDVQPAAALGVSLAAEGARVRLAADPSFGGWIAGLPGGVEFYPLGGKAREMMALTVKWG
jgi:UDP:flavonoid glycosyltransferase YjiC (YdhE family)